MIDLINPVAKEALSQSLDKYFIKWDEYVARMGMFSIAEKMRPTAVGWRVADRTDYKRAISVLDPFAAQMHSVTVGGRKIATVILTKPIGRGIKVIKVIERREGSRDVVGLDHVDFYLPFLEGLAEMLDRGEANWRKQGNKKYEKLSVRFGPESLFEAKISDHTVLNIAAEELNHASKMLLHPSAKNHRTHTE